MAEQLLKRPLAEESVRAFRRRLFSGAVDLVPDRQGRIVLPVYLREFAGIDSEVVVAGMYDYIEVWDTSDWQQVREEIENSGDAARWDSLGI
jgi:MraZ protein